MRAPLCTVKVPSYSLFLRREEGMETAFAHLRDFISFAVTSALSRREEAGAGPGGCGQRCAGELPLRALVRNWSQGPDHQRHLGTYCLFNHLATLILNRSWEHICLGKFWMRSVSGRGQAGSGSVTCHSLSVCSSSWPLCTEHGWDKTNLCLGSAFRCDPFYFQCQWKEVQRVYMMHSPNHSYRKQMVKAWPRLHLTTTEDEFNIIVSQWI